MSPAITYATLLESARIAALEALTDILKTSDDPTERRHAATAILRAPQPKAPPSECPDSECRGFAAVSGGLRGNRPPAEDASQERTPRDRPATTPAPPKLSAVEELLALSRAAYGDLTQNDDADVSPAPEPTAPFIPAATTPAAKLRAAAGAPS